MRLTPVDNRCAWSRLVALYNCTNKRSPLTIRAVWGCGARWGVLGLLGAICPLGARVGRCGACMGIGAWWRGRVLGIGGALCCAVARWARESGRTIAPVSARAVWRVCGVSRCVVLSCCGALCVSRCVVSLRVCVVYRLRVACVCRVACVLCV